MAPSESGRGVGTVRLSAVLFDLDGTLVDTVGTRILAWLQALQEYDLKPDRDQVASLIGSDGRWLARTVAKAAGKSLDEATAEEIDQRSGAIYDRLNTNPQPLPGATSLIGWLERHELPWAIATSSRREQVRQSLAALALARPPRVIDGSQVKEAKPAPDLLLFAAKELDLPPPTIWYVGDSEWDMRAACAANMVAVGVATGAATVETLRASGASLTVNNLGELPQIIDELPA